MRIITRTSTRPARGRNLTLVWGLHDSPAGKMLLALSHEGLCWLGLNCGEDALRKNWPGANLIRDDKVTARAARDVVKGWKNDFKDFALPVVLYGTDFQLKIWRALLKIKRGSTLTYATLAQKTGRPAAVRAAGSAVGKNPVSVLVPCHRVVNKDGGKVNYAWGAKIKTALLKGEGAL